MKNKTHDPAAQQDQALRKERPGVEAPVAGGTRVRPLRLRPAVRGAPPEMGARRLAVAGGNRCRAAADASGGACARPAGLVEAVLTVDGSAVTRAKAEAAVSRLRTQTTDQGHWEATHADVEQLSGRVARCGGGQWGAGLPHHTDGQVLVSGRKPDRKQRGVQPTPADIASGPEAPVGLSLIFVLFSDQNF